MLVSCHGVDLSDAFLSVSKAISTKITNPILEGIKLVAEDDTLTLSATDTELSIERKIKANIKEEGEEFDDVPELDLLLLPDTYHTFKL